MLKWEFFQILRPSHNMYLNFSSECSKIPLYANYVGMYSHLMQGFSLKVVGIQVRVIIVRVRYNNKINIF